MSVPENLRGLSTMQFYINASVIRHDMALFVYSNFGMSQNAKTYKWTNSNISPSDLEIVQGILDKYQLTQLKLRVQNFPEEYLQRIKSRILTFSEEILDNIVRANNIYSALESEYLLRREFQDIAVVNCFNLISELQFVFDNIPSNHTLIAKYIDMLDNEIKLLRSWKGSDTQRYKNNNHQPRHIKHKKNSSNKQVSGNKVLDTNPYVFCSVELSNAINNSSPSNI